MPDGTEDHYQTLGVVQIVVAAKRRQITRFAMPPFDGIGANEYIVAAPNDVCDFISAVDTPAVWELNIWYHVLNCGLRTRISGETDFLASTASESDWGGSMLEWIQHNLYLMTNGLKGF